MQKNILITGTSSGLGNGLANYYLENGFNVIGISRRTPEEFLNNSNYTHYNIDLSNLIESKPQINSIFETYNNFNLVILNSGILGSIDRMENLDINDSIKLMDINLWANKILIDSILDNNITCRQIVGISSGAAVNGSAGWGPYSISKAALNMLIKTYAVENPQIHFCSIAPGLVDTAMQDFIFSLENENNFEAVNKIQAANGTELMPNAKQLSPRFYAMINKVYENEVSGDFFDIRKY